MTTTRADDLLAAADLTDEADRHCEHRVKLKACAYYEQCPRGFSNEYTIHVVSLTDAARFEAAFGDKVRRIGRTEAIRYGWTRPREAMLQDSEQWFGGFSDGVRFHATMNDAMRSARTESLRLLQEQEGILELIAATRRGGW